MTAWLAVALTLVGQGFLVAAGGGQLYRSVRVRHMLRGWAWMGAASIVWGVHAYEQSDWALLVVQPVFLAVAVLGWLRTK